MRDTQWGVHPIFAGKTPYMVLGVIFEEPFLVVVYFQVDKRTSQFLRSVFYLSRFRLFKQDHFNVLRGWNKKFLN